MGLRLPTRPVTFLAAVLLVGCPPDSNPPAGAEASPLATLVSIDLTPATASIPTGGTLQFMVSARASDGTSLVPGVVFSAVGGTITVSGLYTAGTAVGDFRVIARATDAGISDTATVTVAAADGEDQIRLDHPNYTLGTEPIPSDLETVVLLTATPASGPCWWYLRRAGSLRFGSLIGPSDPCHRDEIAVFSVDDPFVLDTSDVGPAGIWTAENGETRVEDLRTERMVDGPRVVNLALWYLTTDALGNCSPVDPPDPKKATELYNANRVGLIFEFGPPQPACDDVNLKPTFPNVYQCPGTSEQPLHFTPGAVNVYYVPSLGDYLRGVHCAKADPHVILIAWENYSETTLAHELGHAFGLSHTYDDWGEWWPGMFDSSNLMWSDWVERSTFSLGQAFRVNVEENSLLNQDLIRNGVKRGCECRMPACTRSAFLLEANRDGICPAISTRWQ